LGDGAVRLQLLAAIVLAIAAAASTVFTGVTHAATTGGQLVAVNGGIDCNGVTPDPQVARGTVTLDRSTSNNLSVTVDLVGGDPNTTFSIELFESGTACGSDNAAKTSFTLTSDASGNGRSVFSLQLPKPSLGGATIGDGAGTEAIVVVLDNTMSTGAGDRASTRGIALPPASPDRYSLAVTKFGDGTGTVSSEPSGISCGATCLASFESGTNVTLIATPAAGSRFKGWGDACSGTSTTCTITMNAQRLAIAYFEPTSYTLQVTTVGKGTVTSKPKGISCGSDCIEGYPVGGTITLEAAPAPGWSFDRWSGDCILIGAPCTLKMDGPRNVLAVFKEILFSVHVSMRGDGDGRVTSVIPGIDCTSEDFRTGSPDCKHIFEGRTSVDLRFASARGSKFVGVQRDCFEFTCIVTVTFSKLPDELPEQVLDRMLEQAPISIGVNCTCVEG
jgi:hypothetical protein